MVHLIDDAAFAQRASTIFRRSGPSAGIPRPADALGIERIADGQGALRRQRRLRRIGESVVLTRGGQTARLIGRLQGIDGKAVGRHRAVRDVLRWTR